MDEKNISNLGLFHSKFRSKVSTLLPEFYAAKSVLSKDQSGFRDI
jgi:hypothetical protein